MNHYKLEARFKQSPPSPPQQHDKYFEFLEQYQPALEYAKQALETATENKNKPMSKASVGFATLILAGNNISVAIDKSNTERCEDELSPYSLTHEVKDSSKVKKGEHQRDPWCEGVVHKSLLGK
jgi:hypothetical protein